MNLEMLCDCECERKGHMYEEYSSECNGMGTLKCGVCECYDGFFGKHCECSSHQEQTGFDKHFQSCRPDNTSLVDCSGRGTCACGQCECEERENPDEVFSKFSSRSINYINNFCMNVFCLTCSFIIVKFIYFYQLISQITIFTFKIYKNV